MPIGGPYSRSGSNHFQDQPKTHPGPKTGLKTRIRERFISSDFKNKPDSGYFKTEPDTGFFFGWIRAIGARIEPGWDQVMGEGPDHDSRGYR